MLHVRSALPPSRGSETSQYWELIFIRHANQGSPDASLSPPCPDRRVVVTASSAEVLASRKELVVFGSKERRERKSLLERRGYKEKKSIEPEK